MHAVSVVVPVGAWTGDARAQVDAICGQLDDHDSELIVVDNTPECVHALLRKMLPAGRVRVVCAHDVRSPSHARNAGAAAARGQIVAFTDADDLVMPGWLAHLVAPFSDRMVGIVGGRLDESELNSRASAATRTGLTTTGLPTGFYFRPYVPSGNLAVRGDLLRAAGGFRAEAVGAEDIDFSWRVLDLGTRAAYAADAVVCVRYRIGTLATCRQGFRWGRGGARLVRRWQADRPGAGPRLPSAGYRLATLRNSALATWRTRAVSPFARQLCYQVGLVAGALQVGA